MQEVLKWGVIAQELLKTGLMRFIVQEVLKEEYLSVIVQEGQLTLFI